MRARILSDEEYKKDLENTAKEFFTKGEVKGFGEALTIVEILLGLREGTINWGPEDNKSTKVFRELESRLKS